MASAFLSLTSIRVCVCCVLTQAAAMARHHHERSQSAPDDAVWPAQGRLLEGTGVLVQKGVHAVGGGWAAIPHEGL